MQEQEQKTKLQHFLSELAILGSLQVGCYWSNTTYHFIYTVITFSDVIKDHATVYTVFYVCL